MPDPTRDPKPTHQDEHQHCDPQCPPTARGKSGGPVREAGGTTGAGNLSAGQADRTGGATGGVTAQTPAETRRKDVTPSA